MSSDSNGSAPFRACVVTNLIAPGGGPPGYVYNWRDGYRSIGEPACRTEFLGSESLERYNGTGVRQREGIKKQLERLPSPVFKLIRTVKTSSERILNRWMRFERHWRRSAAGADVIVLQGYQHPSRLRVARRLARTVVYMPHSPVPCGLQSQASGASSFTVRRELQGEKQLLTGADVVVFPCREAQDSYVEFLSSTNSNMRRVEYVKSGAVESQAAKTTPSANHIILFAGRYSTHKGYDLFLDAAARLAPTRPEAKFVTMGDGPLNQTQQYVHNLGWQAMPDDVIASAAVVVVPNRVAYYDLLPLEAASLGIGLVLTQVGGNVSQLRDLPDSIGCSVEDLASGIEKALDHIDATPDWGARNRESFLQNFTAHEMALRWDRLLEQLATNSAHTSSRLPRKQP